MLKEPEGLRPTDAGFLDEFEHQDILYGFDGFESFLTRTHTGLYFAHQADEAMDQSVYVVVPISAEDAAAMKDNKLAVLDAIRRGGRWYWVNEMWHDEPRIRVARFDNFDDIPTDVLPEAGVTIRP